MEGRRAQLVALIVPTLFFIRAEILAVRIVPLWDLSDEAGHFSYARDIWSGRGLMPLGRAEIGVDIMSDVKGRPSPPLLNSIAAHPPTYHILAGALWKAATLFTDDPHVLFRAPRLLSPLLGAVALFYVARLVKRMGLSPAIGFAAAAGLSAVPRFAWQAAGTSHDIMLAALAIASSYYLADYMLGRSVRSAWLSVLLMSLAAGTKISALVTLTPMLAFIGLEIASSGGGRRGLMLASLTAVSLALPGAWLVRSQMLYGSAFAGAQDILGGFPLRDTPLQVGFLEYVSSEPAVEEFFVSFIGHLGWVGRSGGTQQYFNVPAPFRTVYELALLTMATLTLFWCGRTVWRAVGHNVEEPATGALLGELQRRIPTTPRLGLAVLAGLAALSTIAIVAGLILPTTSSGLLVAAVAFLVSLGVAAPVMFVVPMGPRERAIFYAIMIVALFALVLVWQSYTGYVYSGTTWRTIGRYFYAALGFMVVAWCVPALLALGKAAERVALPAAVVVCVTEAVFFLTRVVPYFTGSS